MFEFTSENTVVIRSIMAVYQQEIERRENTIQGLESEKGSIEYDLKKESRERERFERRADNLSDERDELLAASKKFGSIIESLKIELENARAENAQLRDERGSSA